MNTEKVFTAFNNDGEEILLYRKDNDTFIDLNSDNNYVYPKKYIDLKTLVHASKTLNLKRHMLKAFIKKQYKKDRSELINTKNILVGTELRIINLKKIKHGSGWTYNYEYKWENEQSEEMNLFDFKKVITIDEIYKYNVYVNLFDKREYILFNNTVKNICQLPNFGEGMKYIYSLGDSLEDISQESILEKKKVYEYANMTRKQRNKNKKG